LLDQVENALFRRIVASLRSFFDTLRQFHRIPGNSASTFRSRNFSDLRERNLGAIIPRETALTKPSFRGKGVPERLQAKQE
jgi:hypothetical protein